MTELVDEASLAPPPQPVVSGQHAGALLRAAREAQGLHIAALAVALKVPVKRLESLEAGRYSDLPDMVFVRSLAMSVCRTLKINADDVLAALPAAPSRPMTPAGNGLNTEFKDTDASARLSFRALLRHPLGLGAVVLLMVIAALVFWQGNASAPARESSVAATADAGTAPIPATVVAPAMPAVAAATGASAAIRAVAIDPVVVAPASGPLLISAHGVSWVEVLDASGTALLRKLTADGEVLRVDGTLPLAVTVGRADQVAVQVRGQALDLQALSRDNVAHFEVK